MPAVVGATALLALAAAVACAGGDDDGEAGTDPTAGDDATTTTPTTAPPTPEEEAKAAYLEFVEVVERLATSNPDPDDPDLLRVAVDPVLSSVRDGMATQRAENQLWRRGDRTGHQVGGVERTPDGMRLTDCVVENDVLIDQDDGSVVDAPPLATRALQVSIVESPDGWAVADTATIRLVDGEATCDE